MPVFPAQNHKFHKDSINTKKKESKELDIKINEQNTTYQEKLRSCSELTDEESRLYTAIEDARKVLERTIAENEAAIEDSNRRVILEKEKIEGPLKLIEEENVKLDRRRKAIDILTIRLAKRYKALLPGEAVPFELK